ncbi:hypothetical protein AARAC_011527 [Aspergillus arachidicola]|uniref:Short-chain dehydrogenase/reductase family protein n=1 Tax=Aspergillus arachidicola TaxID=656916 RepID=A0A2G7FKA6_9EURO|nr:hypothetical protein AARAC_011527 [Aspergillus arachidicola]
MGALYSQFFVTPTCPTKGQTVIVTGSNVGIGFEAAKHFVRLNAAKVILAMRNLEAGEAAKRSIETSLNRPGSCEVWELDLASFDSVKAFADRASKLPRLDILVENAGIATYNFELAEARNTFLLGLLLLPKLQATAQAFQTSSPHLSVVTSDVHAWTSFPEWKADNTFVALNDRATADMRERYSTSKLLEVLISQLSREAGLGLRLMIFLFGRTAEVGGRTLLSAAGAGPESHGAYFLDGKVNNAALSPFVRSEAGARAQEKVWRELSEILEDIQPGSTHVLSSS